VWTNTSFGGLNVPMMFFVAPRLIELFEPMHAAQERARDEAADVLYDPAAHRQQRVIAADPPLDEPLEHRDRAIERLVLFRRLDDDRVGVLDDLAQLVTV
jgi:hypothetical protein